MKLFTKNLKKLAFVLLFCAATFSKAQVNCVANFIYSIGSGGVVSFTSTSALTSTTMPTTYYWNFGNNTSYSATGFPGMNAIATYTANGPYVVTLFVLTPPTGSCAVQYTVNITNVAGCGLVGN